MYELPSSALAFACSAVSLADSFVNPVHSSAFFGALSPAPGSRPGSSPPPRPKDDLSDSFASQSLPAAVRP